MAANKESASVGDAAVAAINILKEILSDDYLSDTNRGRIRSILEDFNKPSIKSFVDLGPRLVIDTKELSAESIANIYKAFQHGNSVERANSDVMTIIYSHPDYTVAPPVLDDASWRAGIKAFRAALNEMTGRDGYIVQKTYRAIYDSLRSQSTDGGVPV